MKDCIFCTVERQRSKHLYDDEVCFVILDLYPADYGHLLVIPKKHYENLIETPDEIVEHVFVVAKKFLKKIKKELKPVGGSVIANMGPGHQNHLHIHVIPRYMDSMKINYPPRLAFTQEEAKRLFKRLES